MDGTTLLGFARGPGLEWALAIMVFGIFWRLAGILMLRRPVDLSEPRAGSSVVGAMRMVISRTWPHKEFRDRVLHWDVVSYLFHGGYVVAILGYAPHILLIRALTGAFWPGLPGGVIAFAAGISAVSLIALLVHRMSSPVLRKISNFDDYFSWLVAFLPLPTGLMAYYHLGGRYEWLLGLHMVTGELLLAWLPFGKIMHTILFLFSRATTGVAYTRRGAPL